MTLGRHAGPPRSKPRTIQAQLWNRIAQWPELTLHTYVVSARVQIPRSGTTSQSTSTAAGPVTAVLEILGWSIVAAVAAWGLTLTWARSAFAASRRAADDELQYWQAETIRARAMVAHLRQERALWTRACQQGREDVIAIMPLLVAAQQGLSGARATQQSDANC